MRSGVCWPLATSILGHGCALAALVVLAGRLPPAPLPLPVPKHPIVVVLAPAEPVAETPPQPPTSAPPPVAETPPSSPEPPPPPRPEHKVVIRHPPPARPSPRPMREPPPEPPLLRAPIQPVAPLPMQTAAIPPPPPAPAGPVVSAGYRAALSAWLESHKRYPDTARARGVQGHAVLRFRVERSGRVLNYAIAQSTGYADLDGAIEQMMRGASLPPFPPDMTASDVEFSLPIRFALAR